MIFVLVSHMFSLMQQQEFYLPQTNYAASVGQTNFLLLVVKGKKL